MCSREKRLAFHRSRPCLWNESYTEFGINCEGRRAGTKQKYEKLDCAPSSRRMRRACPPSVSSGPVGLMLVLMSVV